MGSCFSTKKKTFHPYEKSLPSLDPAELLDRSCLNLVLQYLNVAEILEASLVSKKWYYGIGQSTAAMKKIRLRIDSERADNDAMVTTILESPRKYQNLFAQNQRDVIVSLADSLVELHASDIKIVGLEIPNLRKLTIDDDAVAYGLLSCAVNLKELHVKSIKSAAINTLIDCLRGNDKLKVLRLGPSACLIFKEDLSFAFNLHLAELKVNLDYLLDELNFFRFLWTQASSLQHLSIHLQDYDFGILNVAINNFEMLESLHVESFSCNKREPAELPKVLFLQANESIKSIRVPQLSLNDTTRLNDFISAVPNLEVLQVFDASIGAFNFCIINAKKLKKFSTVELAFQIFDGA